MRVMNKKIRLKCDVNCTGCTACQNICPTNCIIMIEDKEGFLYPSIDESKCIECGKCIETCNFSLKKVRCKEISKVYASYSLNESVRQKSSSGGIFSEMASEVIKNGGHVYGAMWGDKYDIVHHTYIDDEADIKKLQGSKYVQSNILDSYKNVLNDINNGKKILFSGTPCQIAGLYKYLKRDYESLITCAVICHGVPSPMVWRKYVRFIEGKKEISLSDISFRDKSKEGWKNFYVKYAFNNYEEYYRKDEDIYFRGFMENLFLRPSCYECGGKWKSDIADIVLGDLWGNEKIIPFVNCYDGVSTVLINTKKGEQFFGQVKKKCYCHLVEYSEVYQYNSVLRKPVKESTSRKRFFEELELTGDIEFSISNNLRWIPTKDNRQKALYPIIFSYLNNVLDGKYICKLFQKWNKKNIVLYANTEIMKFFIKDIQSFNYDAKFKIYLSDRNIDFIKKDMTDFECLSFSEVIEKNRNGEIDIIVVCSLLHENEIINQFIREGVDLDKVVSAVELIYSTDYKEQ